MRKRPDSGQVVLNAILQSGGQVLSNADKAIMRDAVINASLSRATLMNKLLDPRRDIDLECGYPPGEISTEQFKKMYDREGIATRVVKLMPMETWAMVPKLVENEDKEDTEFEKAWTDLDKKHHLWSMLARIDRLSGIGRYGILLLGLNDGADMSQLMGIIGEDGEVQPGGTESKLIYLRALDESLVKIKDVEKDPKNPRFGMPTMYSITFSTDTPVRVGDSIVSVGGVEKNIHWTRVIHVADNRESSEVFGIPRMQCLFNRLYDLRKIGGGSGEMFWKGGFPGISFEMDSNARPIDDATKTALREEIAAYSNGLQRYLVTQGISAKSLNPQVANPKFHVDIQLEMIAIALGVPKRIFMGSEQAKLASVQDSKSWNKRIAERQNGYVTPYLIRVFVDRLIAFGILPEVEDYEVKWPDLDAPGDQDKAEVLKTNMEALAKYVGGGVDALIPEEQFLKMFMKMSTDEIKEIMDASMEREEEMDEKDDIQTDKDIEKTVATAKGLATVQPLPIAELPPKPAR